MKNLFDEPERKVHRMPVVPNAQGMFVCMDCAHSVSVMACRLAQNLGGELSDVDRYCPSPESAEDKFKRLVREASYPTSRLRRSPRRGRKR